MKAMKRVILMCVAVAALALAPSAAAAAHYDSVEARLAGYDLRLDWVESGLHPSQRISYRVTMDVHRTLACAQKHHHKFTTDSISFTSARGEFVLNPFSTREIFALVIRLQGPGNGFSVFTTPPHPCHDGSQPRVVAVTYSNITLYDDLSGIHAPAVPSVLSYTA